MLQNCVHFDGSVAEEDKRGFNRNDEERDTTKAYRTTQNKRMHKKLRDQAHGLIVFHYLQYLCRSKIYH